MLPDLFDAGLIRSQAKYSMAKLDQAKYLKLAESLGGFRNKLRARARTLDVKERQQILRLLVREIQFGLDSLTIRHLIRFLPATDLHPTFLVLPQVLSPYPQSD
jgi:hypothetical protein